MYAALGWEKAARSGQVNMRGGRPPPDGNGIIYIRTPIDTV